ncbi:hypothetical protein [Candidatus Ferrigenium straubiae]|jgi:hypothetical protein|uniref:hypothetical protein n=1 Tax=Candidatus Ferrigenium straubiae TaxID=2919506 RepID=UPI003F4ADC90
MDKNKLISDLSSEFSIDSKGYFITLNAFKNDVIQFEQDLSKIAHKLNDFCYSRAYKRKEKRLKIIAAIETGKVDGMLHAHLIVALQDETDRTLPEMNSYVRKHWYKTIGFFDHFGTMVDVQDIGEAAGRIAYIVKDTNYLLRNDNLNIVML